MTSFADTLARVGELSVPVAPIAAAEWGDQQLLDAQRQVAEVQRRVAALGATIAAEIAHRSRRELGHAGLAQSHGQRTAEGLIAQVTGGSVREARALVRVGELLPDGVSRGEMSRGETPPGDALPLEEWRLILGAAVATGALSVEAADVVRAALGAVAERAARESESHESDPHELADALTRAAMALVAQAPSLTLEQLSQRAARARDELDVAGIAVREEQRRERRYLRIMPQFDGMTRISGLLDPESAAIVVPVLDAITSPRRGGPRFVAPDAVARADDLVRDERTTEQLVLDAFVELIRCGARVDAGVLLGDRRPAVRVLVTARDLDRAPDAQGARVGPAYFEGQSEAVSIATAERFICASGAIPILFDDSGGRVLNLGREKRLFSEKQRIALAARDGGCLMCDRPPSWCEAHHIDHWDEHRGLTNVDDGVLLCRFCHLLVHNKGWRVTRAGGDYFLERPGEESVRTPLPSRSLACERLRASA